MNPSGLGWQSPVCMVNCLATYRADQISAIGTRKTSIRSSFFSVYSPGTFEGSQHSRSPAEWLWATMESLKVGHQVPQLWQAGSKTGLVPVNHSYS